ncbi:MAG TPA: hypothetical protein VI749_07850 [Candidatus Omnitrophota bacterium]|nr:hypothetical protein [Candidatus Omnitrophota bacterium]
MKRQGDLLIIRVERIPSGARPQNTRILAEGEATGHLHELAGGEVYEKQGTLFFKIGHGMEVELTHPEHQTLVFTPGTYKVVRQREYEPEGWRYVSD